MKYLETLTIVERTILDLIMDDTTLSDISDKLNMSNNVINSHAGSIISKYGTITMIGVVKKHIKLNYDHYIN